MKRLFAVFLALCASVAFGTTTVPVQLLNQTGSTSGQAILSTGASSAPAWGNVTISGLASIAANTVVANATGSSAAPTAFAMPSCSATANVLQYTSGTGFTCLTTLFSSPTITTPNLVGVTNASNATAGSVGEYVTATGTAVSLTSGTGTNITSISLTAGDWDVWGNVQYLPAGTTTQSQAVSSVSTTSATQSAVTGALGISAASIAAGLSQAVAAPMQRINVSSTTTVYLVATGTFAVSTETASGFIAARRVR